MEHVTNVTGFGSVSPTIDDLEVLEGPNSEKSRDQAGYDSFGFIRDKHLVSVNPVAGELLTSGARLFRIGRVWHQCSPLTPKGETTRSSYDLEVWSFPLGWMASVNSVYKLDQMMELYERKKLSLDAAVFEGEILSGKIWWWWVGR